MKGLFSLLSADNCLTSCFIITCSYFPFVIRLSLILFIPDQCLFVLLAFNLHFVSNSSNLTGRGAVGQDKYSRPSMA